MTSPRALRVGLLLGGNLVEERVLRDGPITIGQSLKCTLSVPAAGVPREHVLVTRDQGRMLLHVPAGATGKLAQGESITELAGTIVLGHGARGKLVLGDATVLFQEIAAPPLVPRPVLPASIRGTLGDRIDRRLAAIVGASVLVHLAIAGYAWIEDVDTGSMLETPVAMQYRQEVMEVTIPDEPPAVTAPAQTPGAAIPATPVQTSKPIVKPTRVSVKTGAPEPAMSEDDAQRFASILTGSEIGRTGSTEMGNRQPGTDLKKQLDDVGNREVVVGNDKGGFRTKDREGIGTTDGPNIQNPTEVAPQQPKDGERGGRITIKPQPPEGPGTTLTVEMVLDKIKGPYMAGLQRCYKLGLRGDSTLTGKINMSFTVTENGKLDEASARGVSSEVDSCVQDLMGGWRFAIPRDKDGDPTEQPFKLSLALQPS